MKYPDHLEEIMPLEKNYVAVTIVCAQWARDDLNYSLGLFIITKRAGGPKGNYKKIFSSSCDIGYIFFF